MIVKVLLDLLKNTMLSIKISDMSNSRPVQ